MSDVLVAQIPTRNIHDIGNRDVRQQIQRAQDMRERRGIAGITGHDRRRVTVRGTVADATSTIALREADIGVLFVPTRDIKQSLGQILSLPVPPDLVQPGVVQIEDWIAG